MRHVIRSTNDNSNNNNADKYRATAAAATTSASTMMMIEANELEMGSSIQGSAPSRALLSSPLRLAFVAESSTG